MKLVQAPTDHPGCCLLCRLTPKGPYVDLEQVIDLDHAYLCPVCLAEMDRVRGAEPDESLPETLDETFGPAPCDDPSPDAPESKPGCVCDECGKVCANPGALKFHQRSHAKERGA